MSISKGNDYLRSGKINEAINEYKKIKENTPLYNSARFNIELAKKKAGIKKEKISNEKTYKKHHSELPKISIIMPVYNVGPYLDASILSVRYQTHENFELIIINDASSDNGLDIINMHASLDSRIRVISLPHNTLGGAGIPSNAGIDIARGDYIGFVDSDDWVNETAFEELVESAEKHNADVVIGGFRTFLEHNRAYSEAYDLKEFEKLPSDKPFTAREYPNVFRLSPVPWRKLYSRPFLEKNAIRYPEGDYFYEDNPLHWFVLSSHSRVVKIPNIISYHRMAREGQTMGAADYKLGAMCSHINTIGCFLSNHLNMPEDQPVIDEFFDYCYRSSWVSQRQSSLATKNIIGKKIANIVDRHSEEHPPLVKRSNFNSRMSEFRNSYPNYDLSVVIPVYNCEEFIEETIQSVQKAKDISFNILIIDDGSRDGTSKICQALEKKHDNIHFFQQGNKGAGRARNSIIPLCTGEYTFFLDADDIVNGNQLAQAVKSASLLKHDLHFFKYKISFYDKKKEREMFNPDKEIWNEFKTAKNNGQLRALASKLINYPWNRIIKTNLLHDENIFFGPTVVHNDIAYHWSSLLAANNIGYSDNVVCTHRKFEKREQITNVRDQRRLTAFDALNFTHNKIVNHQNGKNLIDTWCDFSENLIDWIEDKIPEELHQQYMSRKTTFLDNLASLKEEKTHNV